MQTERRWFPGDFVVVVLAGLAGALVAAILGAGLSQSALVVVALFAQDGAHLAAVARVVKRRGVRLSDLGLDLFPSDGVWIFFGAALQIALAILFSPLAQLLQPKGSTQALADVIVGVQGMGLRLSLVLIVALLAPVAEELMFRGLLLKIIEERRGPRAALLFSAVFFALFHLLGIGTQDPLRSAAVLMPQLFLVGLILGRLAMRHGRLGPAIFTHAGFNLIAVLALFVAPGLLQP